MKKFIKGTLELDQNITDLETYEEKHKRAIEELIDWANSFDVAINMGTSDDNTYLIEYKIVARTASMCKSLLSEMKGILKEEWKKTKSLWQGSGDILDSMNYCPNCGAKMKGGKL